MTRILLLTIWFLPFALSAPAGQGANASPPAPLDLQGYEAQLVRWSASAHRLGEHPEEAGALRKQLPDHWSVAVQDQRFQVSTIWLAAALDRLAADPKLAKDMSQEVGGRLDSMLRDARDLASITSPAYESSRSKLENILKRREFRAVNAPSSQKSLWDQITDWVWKFLNKFFDRVGGHPAATRTVLWGIVVAMGLAFLVWLVALLSRVSVSDFSQRRLPAPGEDSAPSGSWRDWVQQARAAAARADYRDAVRIIYGAAVRRLGEAGTWQVDPTRTHREYVRLLPTDSAQRPPLVAITTRFESVWYGGAQATAVDFEAVLADLESLG
jgi:hypothetical protein